MPTPIPAGLRLGAVAPADAIAAFTRRGLLEPSFQWQDVWQEEHARAFAVAGVQRLDVLQAFREEVELSVTEGRSLADFRGRMRSRLVEKGFWGNLQITDPATGETRTGRFDDRRLQTVFDVNMRQSHAAGRWARIERNKARFPFVLYRTMQDERVRASHRAWNGLVLPVDHPFWQTHYPPNGWRCRCTAFAVDERELERRRARGETITTEAPPEQPITYVNPRTGETTSVPRGIDPGFGYNPGRLRDAELQDLALRKALATYPLAGAVAVAQAQRDFPRMVAAATAGFGEWVDQVLASGGRTVNDVRYIGAIAPGALRALRDAGREPATAAIAITDRDLWHAMRDAKAAPLDPSLVRRLPELLARAEAVYLDGDELLYVVDLVSADGSVAKLVLQLDQRRKLRISGERRQAVVNVVRSGRVLSEEALASGGYRRIWGR